MLFLFMLILDISLNPAAFPFEPHQSLTIFTGWCHMYVRQIPQEVNDGITEIEQTTIAYVQ